MNEPAYVGYMYYEPLTEKPRHKDIKIANNAIYTRAVVIPGPGAAQTLLLTTGLRRLPDKGAHGRLRGL